VRKDTAMDNEREPEVRKERRNKMETGIKNRKR
jgi:hypothetical protein